ncbi:MULTISPECIES: hypothetical protein [Burkholderia]|uniref:Cytochrome c family protein n=2 Tax=Burkholderia TaxID=32008 RepID=A0ABU5WQ30_9BURK|nr:MULTISPECIES: hypothetical protein [Burkholderia]MEB2504283.1 hypothetical protein [Burkholderia anthinoferrum]MEB2531409.1 hypothetical protein [Burkholderia anthinoferrum]MEB2561318.1 hypothetical protein [Burkholderia anthinoferrum]MEB2581033.1 hypothetical protein [Burkholderia anthinoferrum]MCA8032416.1 hypothetical protein [Burkholderia arboris]
MKNLGSCVAVAMISCCAGFSQPAAAKPCTAFDQWFTSAGITEPNYLDPQFQDPNDPKNENCNFHRFSWHAFLWLTDTLNGAPRFDSLYSDAAIDPSVALPTEHVLDGVQQADSLGIVIDRNGRAVYTNMYINPIYRDFSIANKLYTRAGMQNARPTLEFTTGALSLKAAWKIVGANEDTSRFYTTTARIQLLAKTGNAVGIPPQPSTATVKVALVGFHIAWVVKGHPEAIWSTFEHVDNAPDFQPNQRPSQPVSDKSFTFYQAGTKASDCNVNNASRVTIDEKTQILAPVTQVCRQYQYGGADSTNQANITELNGDILARLVKNNSIWQYYREVGAVWIKDPDEPFHPDWSPNFDSKAIRGTPKLSNSVIETFTQNQVSKHQCFSCHNTMAVTDTNDLTLTLPGKDISTSHILLRKYMNNPQIRR